MSMLTLRSKPATYAAFAQRLLQALSLGILASLAACGGGGGSGSSMINNTPTTGPTTQSCNSCGAAVVSLSDAPGDFLSYIVKVVSLQLTRADGTLVETVPVTTQVDFAQLVTLAEIISARQVPAGRYVSASITLDYSGATIVVDNGSGGVAIAPSQIINGATSAALTAPNSQVTLTLSLGTNNQLIVNQNSVAHLALDFNLLASNAVTPSPSAPTTVTVNPVLTASLVPDAAKQMRVRGPLVSVNNSATAGSYVINVRPFNDADDTSGQVTVNTTSTTTFSINGMSYTGSAGLGQLAMLAAGTMTAAFGSWDKTTQTFTASSVTVGNSVAGTGHDSAEGTVIARSGSTLTLANSRVLHSDRDGTSFAGQITVTIGTATAVTADGQTGSLPLADISVGQHVQVSGTLGTDSSGNATLNATAVRLMLTSVQGSLTVNGTSMVTLTLQSLDGRPASAFTFAGTGKTAAQDATAAAYTVGIAAGLSTLPLSVGLPARFSGFVAPFGQAPPDFTASTLVSYAQTRAYLDVRWPTAGVAAPFATLTSAKLVISQSVLQGSPVHALRIGPQLLDPSALSAGLQIVPDTAAANPQYAIGHRSSRMIDNFNTFTDFVTALTTDLNGTVAALAVEADGPYNATIGVLSVDQMAVILNN